MFSLEVRKYTNMCNPIEREQMKTRVLTGMSIGVSLLTNLIAILTAVPSRAQQITGTPGSPSATITIDGKQIPPPPTKFEGVIKEDAKDSKSYWPPRVVPPYEIA